MKKISKMISLLWALLILTCHAMPIGAAQKPYSWYCTHRKDNLQPRADGSLAFIEKYNAYYVDKAHGDNCLDKVIYLTFDAGYENGNVARILDVLKQEKVTAAFFVLGGIIKKNTDVVNRMFDEGHLVCNHTYSHRAMAGVDKATFSSELEKLEYVCKEYTGKQLSCYYRPPEGVFDEQSLSHAQELGYKTIFWSFAYADWDNGKQMSPETAKRKILENVHNGEIMLLHPTSETNAIILKDVICELKSMGYRFGSLDEIK